MLFAVGGAGTIILFVCLGVLFIIVAAYALAFAAHCYLVVVQGTTSGIDRVEWPDEPLVDWIGRALYLGSLLSVWIGPVGILSRALRNDWLVGQDALRFFMLACPVVWFFFPLTLLSSLGATSSWAVLSPRVLMRLGRLFPTMLLFYLLSGIVVLVTAALTYGGLFTDASYAVPVAALACAAGLLIHGRLLGQMGWLISELPEVRLSHKGDKGDKGDKSDKADKKPRRRKEERNKETAVSDPWAVPEEAAVEEPVAAMPGYRVVEVEEPPSAPSAPAEDEPEPYALSAAEPVEVNRPRPPILPAQVEREVQLRTRQAPNPPPAYPLFSGVWTFPLYTTTQKAALWLTLAWLGMLGLMRMLILLWPF